MCPVAVPDDFNTESVNAHYLVYMCTHFRFPLPRFALISVVVETGFDFRIVLRSRKVLGNY